MPDYRRDTSGEIPNQQDFINTLQTDTQTIIDALCNAIEYHAVGVHVNSGEYRVVGKNLAQIWLTFETNQSNRRWYDYELRRIAEQIHSWYLIVNEAKHTIRVSYGYRVAMPDTIEIQGVGIQLERVTL